ncbi:sensor histidine kinase [Winogradskyella poriferorum]|uniref:sensor histidine kinase n=1 Tax=Winogradskyella poriferorum TaxID=307627 RepID=UPI003D652159
MNQKLLQFFLSPFTIAGVVTLLVILLLPNFLSEYEVKFIERELLGDMQNIYYEDLDGDGKSEKILSQPQQAPGNYNASYLLFKSNGDFIDQFNLDQPFCNSSCTMWFKDLNNDGRKEFYIPTKSEDSLFLTIQDYDSGRIINQKRVFVDIMSPYNNKFEFKVLSDRPFSQNSINKRELYFAVMNGYAANPRNIYTYDYSSNVIFKSPHITNPGHISGIADLDGDSKNEMLIDVYASSNTLDSLKTNRSDYSTWLTVLDDDMSFLFEPIEFSSTGSIYLSQITQNDLKKLICFFKSRRPSEAPSQLLKLAVDGTIEKKVSVETDTNVLGLVQLSKETVGIYRRNDGILSVYDYELNTKGDIQLETNINTFNKFDFDGDGEDEWICHDGGGKNFLISREDLCESTKIEIPISENSVRRSYGVKSVDSGQNQLYFQNGSSIFYFTYGKNPSAVFKYPIYGSMYLGVLGILLLVVRGQKNIEANKRAIEKEISELQLKTVKNQVDPHFVFNAINTISEMTLTDNKLEADNFISKFSNFMRQTLKQSDKISTTLKQELSYTENFIKLQQIRLKNKFDYDIQIDSSVDVNMQVPKHILYTYVENAIKHGLALTIDGMLKIAADKTKEFVELTIEDNGVGIRYADEPKSHSTGSGLKIMDKIYGLYTKFYKQRIEHQLLELKNKNGTKSGVRIVIHIYPKKRN